MSKQDYHNDCPICGDSCTGYERIHTDRSYKGAGLNVCIRPADGYNAFEVFHHPTGTVGDSEDIE